MKNTWFTSDFHFLHRNMARGTSIWDIESTRDFKDKDHMTRSIIDTLNSHVKEDDALYFMGDFCFGSFDTIRYLRQQILVKEFHFILGNHDKTIRKRKEAQALFTSVEKWSIVTINKQRFFLIHYPMRAWDGSAHGTICLYGHSHGNMPDYGMSMDVGVDVAFREFGEYRPFHIDEILQKFTERINIYHHD